MSVAPANTASVLVVVSGVVQDPSTYSVSGTTLTFSAAPPSGTSNISARYLGIPASGVTTTAYRTKTEFTATAGQTTFTPPSYTVGYIDVFLNGVLLGSADYTATNGTTVVLTTGASSGNLVTVESFYVSSVLNAIPNTAGAVSDSNINTVSASKLTGSQTIPKATLPTGSVLQVVSTSSVPTYTSTSSTNSATPITASITPTSATSKILITVTGGILYGSTTNSQFWLTLYRGGSNIGTGNRGMQQNWVNGASWQGPINISYLDSPATTSSTTYTLYGATNGTVYINSGDTATATITLMEIAA